MMSRSILSAYGGRLPLFERRKQNKQEQDHPQLAEQHQLQMQLQQEHQRQIDTTSAQVEEAEHHQASEGSDAEEEAALAKFRELDVDGNGSLKGAEMKRLAQWVLDGFGQTMQGQRLGRRIMDRLDANGDGHLQFEEFHDFYVEKRQQMAQFRRKHPLRRYQSHQEGQGEEL